MSRFTEDLARSGRSGILAFFWATTQISFHLIASHRASARLRSGRLRRLAGKMLDTYARVITGCYISSKSIIGGGLQIPHPTGIVIGDDVVIGTNAIIYQNVTIGSSDRGANAYPHIGDNVTIFANAVLIGKIRVGDGAKIGAGAVVLRDVPDNGIAVGNPARILSN